MMEWFFTHYTTDVEGVELHDPRLSPLHAASLAGQPPAVLVTAEFDPLRDEGEAYAARLAADGVSVDTVRYDGMIHGFIDMAAMSPGAEAAMADMVSRFRTLLHR
jgi:acetyl esterase